jgi:carbamoyl-phosphate synthase large subunit
MRSETGDIRVLIAGIGGASLGTELIKCLSIAGRYVIIGCDVSGFAYGHYVPGVERTFVVDRNDYVESVLKVCRTYDLQIVMPGAEQPMLLLNAARASFERHGIRIAGNSQEVVRKFSDKAFTFRLLKDLGFQVPQTVTAESGEDLEGMMFPCVIKPAEGSGGSGFVFIASDAGEAAQYVTYLLDNGKKALVQEYVGDEEGEFTVGVLHLPNGRLVGSIALRRLLEAKLSCSFKGRGGIISSGYSQGLIDQFPDLCRMAERIASAVGSEGPLNIQGRVRGGALLPFEINPRFSASAYLRALAGFNEPDIFLQHLVRGTPTPPVSIRPGYYLRSLAECYVPLGEIRL